MKTIISSTGMLMRRELWEHKNVMFWTPLAIALVIIVFLVLTTVWASVMHGEEVASILDAGAGAAETPVGQDAIVLDFSSGQIVVNNADSVEMLAWTSQPANVSNMAFHEIAFGFRFLAFLIGVFYLLGALYNDRKDRSILFWKSLPFSEAQGVLAKLLMATVGIPLIALFASLMVQIIAAIIMIIFFSSTVHYSLGDVLGQMSLISIFLTHFALIGVFAIKTLPLYSWLLFCSAVAKRSPFLFAVIPPALIIVLELFLFRTTVVADFITSVFFNGDMQDSEREWWGDENAQQLIRALFVITPMQFLKIVLVSAPLIAGTIWFRDNHYEI